MGNQVELVATKAVAGAEEFEIAAHFRKDNSDGVEVGKLGPIFRSVFVEKIERKVPAATLHIYKRSQNNRPPEIIIVSDNQPVMLAQLWELLKLQPKGPNSAPGDLFTDGRVNGLNVLNGKGVLWGVSALWREGWNFYADPSCDYPVD